MKNISGIWATGDLRDYASDHKRRVGKLSAEAGTGTSKSRLLEVLYCECCGTQLLSGFRTILPNENGAVVACQPEQLPDDGSVVRTDEADYGTLGVIYLVNESEASSELAVQWNHALFMKNSNYGPLFEITCSLGTRYTTSRVG